MRFRRRRRRVEYIGPCPEYAADARAFARSAGTPSGKILNGQCPHCDDHGITDNLIYGIGRCSICGGLNIWPLVCAHCDEPLFLEVVHDDRLPEGRVDTWVHNSDGTAVCDIIDGKPIMATPKNPPPKTLRGK